MRWYMPFSNPMAHARSEDDILNELYSGSKAGFRSLHEKLIKQIHQFGDFETVPKKGYVSLRRKKQFAMIGPKTSTRFEVGINAKDLKKSARLLEQPTGSMSNYIVNINEAREIDSQLVSWLKSAFEGAG
ncbi:MAG: DUF5655 domain-containing protein [Chloroflexi bacterium]|nr:DUF5655 domain-containing protein [Chloroflexota bacterium]